jgi:hypothetical protein
VFENRLLRRIFEPKRNEVPENGENYIMRNLYYSPNIDGMMKSKRIRWAGNVACM